MWLAPLLEAAVNGTATQAEAGHGFELFALHFNAAHANLLYVLVFILVTTIARIIFHYYEISLIPESALIIVLGALFGLILYAADSLVAVFQFNPDAFFLILIPPIILEAGYFLQKDLFFKNLGTILLYAVIATFAGTFLVGISLWGCTGSMSVNYSLVEMLVFGSLISAVDPIAVLAIFEEIHVNETLNILAFGESVVNDAVSIVLYRLFVSLQTTDFTVGVGFLAIIKFFLVAFGGIAIGIISALASALLTKYTGHIPVLEPLIILTMAYFSYIVAEIFQFSGIMAILFCGICMSHYTEHNITHKSHTTIKYFMKMFAATAETIVFMFLGVSFIQGASGLSWHFGFTILTYIFCMLYRAVMVFGLSALANRYRLMPIPFIDQFVLFFGGLRGAIAFALAFILNKDFAAPPGSNSTRQRDIVLTTTLVIIMITVFIHGATMKPLLNWLKVARSNKERFADRSLGSHVLPQALDPIVAAVNAILGRKAESDGTKAWWRRIDQKVKSIVLRVNNPHDDKMADMLDALNFKLYRDVYEEVKLARGCDGHHPDAHDEVIRIAEAIDMPKTRQLDTLCDEFSKERPEVDNPYQYAVSQRDMRDFHRHHKEIPTGVMLGGGGFSYSGYSSGSFTSISYYSEEEDDMFLPPGAAPRPGEMASDPQVMAAPAPTEGQAVVNGVAAAPVTPAQNGLRKRINGVSNLHVPSSAVRRQGSGHVHVVTMQQPSPPSNQTHGLPSTGSEGPPESPDGPPPLSSVDTPPVPGQSTPSLVQQPLPTPPHLLRTVTPDTQRHIGGKKPSQDSISAEVNTPAPGSTPPTPNIPFGRPPPSPDRAAPGGTFSLHSYSGASNSPPSRASAAAAAAAGAPPQRAESPSARVQQDPNQAEPPQGVMAQMLAQQQQQQRTGTTPEDTAPVDAGGVYSSPPLKRRSSSGGDGSSDGIPVGGDAIIHARRRHHHHHHGHHHHRPHGTGRPSAATTDLNSAPPGQTLVPAELAGSGGGAGGGDLVATTSLPVNVSPGGIGDPVRPTVVIGGRKMSVEGGHAAHMAATHAVAENAFGHSHRRRLDKLDSNLAAFLVASQCPPQGGAAPSGLRGASPTAQLAVQDSSVNLSRSPSGAGVDKVGSEAASPSVPAMTLSPPQAAAVVGVPGAPDSPTTIATEAASVATAAVAATLARASQQGASPQKKILNRKFDPGHSHVFDPNMIANMLARHRQQVVAEVGAAQGARHRGHAGARRRRSRTRRRSVDSFDDGLQMQEMPQRPPGPRSVTSEVTGGAAYRTSGPGAPSDGGDIGGGLGAQHLDIGANQSARAVSQVNVEVDSDDSGGLSRDTFDNSRNSM